MSNLRHITRCHSLRVSLRTATALLAIAGASAVHATETAAAAVVEAESGRELEEIVVTGEKSARSLQTTVTSVRVFTAKEIERENLLSVFDVLQRTANLNPTFASSGFTIRGIANDNVNGVGTGDLATVYLDGSPMQREALGGGALNLWDLAQVEVLRGPQSTLQGRNALAGAIILRTNDPTYEWTGRARVILTGEDGQRRFAGAIGGPIVEDQIAFRIAAENGRTKGLITNTTLDDNRAGHGDIDTLRAKLLITPKALPDLRIVMGWLHNRSNAGATYVLGSTEDAWDNRIIKGNRPTTTRIASDIGTLDLSYRLSSQLNLSSVSTYSHIINASVYDSDNLPEDIGYGDFSQDRKTFTQELRLNFDTGALKGLVGVYYSHLDNPQDRSHSVFNLSPVDDLGLPAEISDFYPAKLSIETAQFYPQDVTTLALFGDAAWRIAPRWQLLGGFRYDREAQNRANENAVSLVTPLPDPANFGDLGLTIADINSLILGQVSSANASSPLAHTSFSAFLPKFGVTYDVSDDATISGIVQRGYRSGGSGVNPARGALYTYLPEFTWNYEVSLRTLWLDNRLAVNANGFYIDWTNQQVNVQLSGNTYDYQTLNAGSSRVFGFEVESRFQASHAFSMYGSIGYNNTRFSRFTTTVGTTSDLSGNEFANAPRLTVAAGGNWQSDKGWFVNLNANYRSAAFQAVLDQTARDVPSYTIVNAKIGWQNKNFGAFFTATNLFNSRSLDYSYINGSVRQTLLGQPRILGITLQSAF